MLRQISKKESDVIFIYSIWDMINASNGAPIQLKVLLFRSNFVVISDNWIPVFTYYLKEMSKTLRLTLWQFLTCIINTNKCSSVNKTDKTSLNNFPCLPEWNNINLLTYVSHHQQKIDNQTSNIELHTGRNVVSLM